MIEGHRGLHIDLVEIGAFFPIDFDTDKMPIHERRNGLVLKRLPLHHVTPVTGGIPDREQDGTVLRFRCLQGFRPPGVPVDRVRGMLEEIGTGFVDESIGLC